MTQAEHVREFGALLHQLHYASRPDRVWARILARDIGETYTYALLHPDKLQLDSAGRPSA
jgi:hypothetical protein